MTLRLSLPRVILARLLLRLARSIADAGYALMGA